MTDAFPEERGPRPSWSRPLIPTMCRIAAACLVGALAFLGCAPSRDAARVTVVNNSSDPAILVGPQGQADIGPCSVGGIGTAGNEVVQLRTPSRRLTAPIGTVADGDVVILVVRLDGTLALGDASMELVACARTGGGAEAPPLPNASGASTLRSMSRAVTLRVPASTETHTNQRGPAQYRQDPVVSSRVHEGFITFPVLVGTRRRVA